MPIDEREHFIKRGRKSAPTAAMIVGLALSIAPLLARLPGSTVSAQSTSAAVMPGETLAFDRSKGNCLTCHAIKGGDAPGNVGPELSNMKSRYPNRDELAAIIYDETKRNPLTVMPPFGRNLILSDREIESVIDFLYTR